MRKKFFLCVLTASLSVFLFGCGSTNYELKGKNIPLEKSAEKEVEEYLNKISSTIVNISLDGSLRQMRSVAENGEFSENMKEELKKSKVFFQELINEFENYNVPQNFEQYNEEILIHMKKANEALENLQKASTLEDIELVKEDIKKEANNFIDNNKEVSNIIDKVLLYFTGC